MPKRPQRHVLNPDFVASVTDLPVAELRALGVKVLAFDLDNTLAHRRTRKLEEAIVTYLESLRESGFKIIIASNALIDLSHIAGPLGATVVRAKLWRFKPFWNYYQKLIAAAGVEPHEIAMIGDRLLNDIIGANLAGLVTVKVEPYFKVRSFDANPKNL